MKFALIRMQACETRRTRWRIVQNAKHLCTSLIIVHRYKQHGMTFRKAFYKKLKEGKAGFAIRNFRVNPYYEPLVQFMITSWSSFYNVYMQSVSYTYMYIINISLELLIHKNEIFYTTSLPSPQILLVQYPGYYS